MNSRSFPVLVVDDDDLSVEVLRETLVRDGYEVVVAANGSDALRILQEGRCRLIISDWLMPGMDGLELCRRIRGTEFPGYIYVILLTSKDGNDDVVDALSAGADDFLTKPFNPAELKVRIRAGARIVSLETRDVAIFALAKLAESRDPETGAHLERIRHYCRLLATHLATVEQYTSVVTADFIRLIFLTSPLHDIGKVGIPDCVLLKPGRLSDQEFAIMKEHAQIGADTLDAAAREYPGVPFLIMARDIALTHHERFNGAGYPHGLKGCDIPLAGRITALADVYDALTSKRVYKEAFTHEITRGIIVEERSKHFDPDIVDAFLAVEPQFLEVRQRFAEEVTKRAA